MTKKFCPYCLQEDDWVDTGRKLKDGTKIHTNLQGSRWAGRRCPSCEKSRVKQAIRYDAFDRELIIRALKEQGYEIVSDTVPFKVRKEGKLLPVAIRRAQIVGGQIAIDDPIGPSEQQVTILVFQDVRVFSQQEMAPYLPRLRALATNHPL
jgi:hypothetical protein